MIVRAQPDWRPCLIMSLHLLALLVAFAPTTAQTRQERAAASPTASIVATDLVNPRGLAWDTDGRLLVASAGRGRATAGIVRVDAGCPVPVVEGGASIGVYNSHAGIADLALLDGELFALSAAIGAPNGLYRVDGASLALVADLGAWLERHPPRHRPPDYTPAGILHAFTPIPGERAFWVLESNHGRLLRVPVDGEVAEVADLSAGHPVPVGVAAAAEGGAYVAYFGIVPYTDGAARIVRVDPSGDVVDVWRGLTALADVAVDRDGRLYAVEMATGNTAEAFLRPGTGRLLRRDQNGRISVVADRLDRPVSLAFGPDDAAYVAAPAFGADDGGGQVVRFGEPSVASPPSGSTCVRSP
ncbi:MAG: ScyD/ScyE family protein [Chloroflexota bacterium]|nr:ScyD/ScyE family protein [Chloroflexota bacterium]